MGRRRLSSLLLLSGIGLALGCAGEVAEQRAEAPPRRGAAGASLACGVLEPELAQALRETVRSVRVAPPGEVPECDRAALAVGHVGPGCVDRGDCQTPPFIDSTALPLPGSRYDAVLIFDVPPRVSSTSTVRESRCADPAEGADRAGGKRVRCRRYEQIVTSAVAAEGWSGLVFLYRPRAGQVAAGRRFSELTTAGLRELLDGLR